MSESGVLREQIRTILQEVIPKDPAMLERTLNQIMQLVDPFQQLAREEMDRYHATFAKLANRVPPT